MKSNNKLTLLILSILTLGVACSSSDDDDSPNNTTNYRISSQSEYTPDGNLSVVLRYYYNSDGSLAYRTNEEYNSSNSGQRTEDEYNRTVYEYNSDGLMIKELRYRPNSDGELISDYNNTYTYDSSNRMVKRVTSYNEARYGDSVADDTRHWGYSGSSAKPAYREIDNDSDDTIDNNTSYTYDDDRVIMGKYDSDMDGDMDDYQWDYIYNSVGQYIEFIQYSQPKTSSTYFYVENRTYDANGQLTKYEEIYDDDANGVYVYSADDVEGYSTYVYETGFCDISAWTIFDELYTAWCL